MYFDSSMKVATRLGDAISICYDVRDVACAARVIFGADAALAAAFSAVDARLDGRCEDFQFWTSVFHILNRD